MNLFDPILLNDAQRLAGANHCFLKQLASEDGALMRRHMEGMASLVNADLSDRWRELLNSLDNRRFFQGFAEIATAHTLYRAGWNVSGLSWPGPMLSGQTPKDESTDIMVLSFIRQVRPDADVRSISRLVRALNRMDAQSRIGVYVQRWIPHDFEPEPVRRAVEMWLKDVQRHGGRDRYAVYADDHISLEFVLTREPVQEGQAIVSFVIGPFSSQKTLEAVEQQILRTLQSRESARTDRPLLLCCVTEQPWRLTQGWLQEWLYGKATWQCSSAQQTDWGYPDSVEPSLFRSRQHKEVSGIIMMDRNVGISAHTHAVAYLNPWAAHPFPAQHMDLMPTFALRSQQERESVMTWYLESVSLSNPGI